MALSASIVPKDLYHGLFIPSTESIYLSHPDISVGTVRGCIPAISSVQTLNFLVDFRSSVAPTEMDRVECS